MVASERADSAQGARRFWVSLSPSAWQRMMNTFLMLNSTAIIIVSNQNNLLSGPDTRLQILESQIRQVANDVCPQRTHYLLASSDQK